MPERYPLGRKEAPDDRDLKFPMRLVTPVAVDVTSRYWYAYNTHCDQIGGTCVANAWTHFLTDSPRTHKMWSLDANSLGWPIGGGLNYYVSEQSGEVGFRGWLYDRAQNTDEFDDTPPEDGTSVRAGAKALQALGAIKSYHWAATVGEIGNAVLTAGPVVMGTTWLYSMFDPEMRGDKAWLTVDPDSGEAGGHAWVINGYNANTGDFRMKNSWGKGWGVGSHAYLSSNDLAYLFNHGGEACIGLEP